MDLSGHKHPDYGILPIVHSLPCLWGGCWCVCDPISSLLLIFGLISSFSWFSLGLQSVLPCAVVFLRTTVCPPMRCGPWCGVQLSGFPVPSALCAAVTCFPDAPLVNLKTLAYWLSPSALVKEGKPSFRFSHT